MYLDFTLDSGSQMTQAIPSGWTAFAYVLSGAAKFGKSLLLPQLYNWEDLV